MQRQKCLTERNKMKCKHFHLWNRCSRNRQLHLNTVRCALLQVIWNRIWENKEHARNLMVSDYDMDRNWVCIYDTLSKDDLTCEWKGIKTYFCWNNVTFCLKTCWNFTILCGDLYWNITIYPLYFFIRYNVKKNGL